MFLELPEVSQSWLFSTNCTTILAPTILEKVMILNLLSSILTRHSMMKLDATRKKVPNF
jgi:hypothetical protein